MPFSEMIIDEGESTACHILNILRIWRFADRFEELLVGIYEGATALCDLGFG